MQMLEQKIALSKESESRRPDYLKRTKRKYSDPKRLASLGNNEIEDSVGITMSPVKGRRLELFQETSEESFEESLMAGGYGRYVSPCFVIPSTCVQVCHLAKRTFDWGGEQPTSISASLSSVNLRPAPEITSPKDSRKRKRLEAFRDSSKHNTPRKLYPVQIQGKGRILLDNPVENKTSPPGLTPKGRSQRRRKKMGAEDLTFKVNQHDSISGRSDGPNWPDSEFPWRLRSEERAQLAREEEQHRLLWIEKYLSDDTDMEDEGDEQGASAFGSW